jgi:SAM-dependent methyltransferase
LGEIPIALSRLARSSQRRLRYGRNSLSIAVGRSQGFIAVSEYERWQSRFSAPEYIFGERPNAFLASCENILPKSGRALCVADGEGRNGVFLAECGLDTLSIDFSPNAQEKARALAASRGVVLRTELADIHAWDWPDAEFDVVAEIFTQFSDPANREIKWAGMRRSLKPGGLLLIEGYTPKQLHHGTGGPKQVDHLYTADMLRQAFGDLAKIEIREYEAELSEGGAHSGMSAVVDLVARK